MTDRRQFGTTPEYAVHDERTIVPTGATVLEGQRLTETDSAVAFLDEQTELYQSDGIEMVSPDMIIGPADDSEGVEELAVLFDDKTDLDVRASQLHRHARRFRESQRQARRVHTRPAAHLSSTASGQGRAESVG